MEQPQQTAKQTQETKEEENKLRWIVSEHQIEFLLNFRNTLISQRAYEVLNMSQETLYSAAQANGYSLGRLKLIDELIDAAQVVRPN